MKWTFDGLYASVVLFITEGRNHSYITGCLTGNLNALALKKTK